jgi:hypothetical protein
MISSKSEIRNFAVGNDDWPVNPVVRIAIRRASGRKQRFVRRSTKKIHEAMH